MNTAGLRNPRDQGALVSLAGPLTNLILALISAFVFIAVFRTMFNASFDPSVLSRVVLFFSVANIGLMAFNLVPVPPSRLGRLRAGPARPLLARLPTHPALHGDHRRRPGRPQHLPSRHRHVGPLTWLILHLYNWWLGVLHVDIRFA